jgi:deoxycytidylate deaminase
MPIDRSYFVSSAIDDEIVFGVVAPLGTRVDLVQEIIHDRLQHFGYALESVRFSELIETLEGFATKLDASSNERRFATYMNAGNELRKKRADLLALAAIRHVQRIRLEKGAQSREPLKRIAYFLRTLKHPEEVRTLREVYGNGFFLLGVSSARKTRFEYLHEHKNIEKSQANELLERDESEEEGYGQQTRDAFQLADAFIALGDENEYKKDIWRLLDLLFGQSFFTPTQEEHAMFLAYAASLRSADLSRQVGAVITSTQGDVLATGANDVPRAGGGQYWTEGYVNWPQESPKKDHRDWAKGKDANKEQRDRIIDDFAARVASLARAEALNTINEVVGDDGETQKRLVERFNKWEIDNNALRKKLEGSRVMDLTEYGRAVHAEMEALLCCTRIGISARGAKLFTTTFPCHNCTKHIIAAGIDEVFFIEPYPKSMAQELHPNEIIVAKAGDHSMLPKGEKRVMFRAFSGVGPRRFFDLFSLQLGSGRSVDRKADVKPGGWKRDEKSRLRVSTVVSSYLDRESGAVVALKSTLEREHGAGNEHPHEQ